MDGVATDLAEIQARVNKIPDSTDFSAGTDRGNRGFASSRPFLWPDRPAEQTIRLDGVVLTITQMAPPVALGEAWRRPGAGPIRGNSRFGQAISAEYGKTSGGVVNAIQAVRNQSAFTACLTS